MREKEINNFEPPPNLDKVLEEIARLKKGYALLTSLWFGGLTNRNVINDDLRWKIEEFFGIDNSE